jgi:hypothetical protein
MKMNRIVLSSFPPCVVLVCDSQLNVSSNTTAVQKCKKLSCLREKTNPTYKLKQFSLLDLYLVRSLHHAAQSKFLRQIEDRFT